MSVLRTAWARLFSATEPDARPLLLTITLTGWLPAGRPLTLTAMLPSVTPVTCSSVLLANTATSSALLPNPEPEMVTVVRSLMLSGEIPVTIGVTEEEYVKEQVEWQELWILPMWKTTSPV